MSVRCWRPNKACCSRLHAGGCHALLYPTLTHSPGPPGPPGGWWRARWRRRAPRPPGLRAAPPSRSPCAAAPRRRSAPRPPRSPLPRCPGPAGQGTWGSGTDKKKSHMGAEKEGRDSARVDLRASRVVRGHAPAHRQQRGQRNSTPPPAPTCASCRSACTAHTPMLVTMLSTQGTPFRTASEALGIGRGVPAGGRRNCGGRG
jgi:hypothetical protein